MAVEDEWAPDACTLPTAERPLRVAEFDDLFTSVRRSIRSEPTRLELTIPTEAEVAARDLAERESQCCTFFTFAFEPVGDAVVMRIDVPPDHLDVLDAIETNVRKLLSTVGASAADTHARGGLG